MKNEFEFLIAEFNAIQQRAIQYNQEKSSRINFFLLIVAAILTGIVSIIGSESSLIQNKEILILIGSAFIFILGLFTMKHVVDYSILMVLLYRKAGRIRFYFVAKYPELAAFVPFEYADDRPKIGYFDKLLNFRGFEYTISLITSLSLGVFFVNWGITATNEWAMIVLLGCLLTYLCWKIQKSVIQKYLEEAEAEEEEELGKAIRYPWEKTKKLF